MGILTAKNKGFLITEIEGDWKLVMNCYNKKNDIPSFILLLMEDISKLSPNLNIYVCWHVHGELNIIIDCLANKNA